MNASIETMIKENEKLIYKIANSLYRQNKVFSKEDLIQVGFLAICKSANKYDQSRGKVSTFITHCAKNDMLKFINKNKINKSLIYDNAKDLQYDETEDILKSDLKEYFNLKNNLEEKIIRLKFNGESNVSIGRILNIKSSKISSTLKAIKERLESQNA